MGILREKAAAHRAQQGKGTAPKYDASNVGKNMLLYLLGFGVFMLIVTALKFFVFGGYYG